MLRQFTLEGRDVELDNYRQMIDILHGTACVIALYKIIEAALVGSRVHLSQV